MNYEQKYKNALDRARHYYLTGKGEPVDFIKMIFPELNESEDERIKREILELVSIAGNGNQFEEIKNWIENQGEPEDKESDDELTWLKTFIEEEAYYLSMDIRDETDRERLIKLQKALAWLEKQRHN